MIALTETQWLVLNATSDDAEDLERIFRTICLEFSAEEHARTEPDAFYWREAKDAVPLSEIVDAIRVLVDRGLLAVRLPEGERDAFARSPNDPSYLWHGWFGITSKGRVELESQEGFGVVDS
jgi:hypothetical protein